MSAPNKTTNDFMTEMPSHTRKAEIPLYQIIHTETVYLHRERLVLSIANTIASDFHLKADGQQLQDMLNTDGAGTDAEILVEWVTQRLMAWEEEQAGLLIDQLRDELNQAMRTRGGK